MIINNEIKDILVQGKFNGNIYLLPEIQLDRKLYINVNKVLEALGGKWKTRVGHIFDGEQEELEEALIQVLENGEVTTLSEIKKQFQYFPTPYSLAQEMVIMADIQEYESILEPSVGQGAILDAILNDSANNAITTIEYNIDNYNEIINKYKHIDNSFHYNMDFLEYDIKTFDKIIANPPFSKNQDIKHILHMYKLLNNGGRIISVASAGIKYKETNLHKQLMALNPTIIDIESHTFKESGTLVETCLVILNK